MKPEAFMLTTKYGGYDVIPQGSYYQNGHQPAIKLIIADGSDEGELAAIATINLPVPLEDGEVFIKTWSENEGMTDALVDAGLIEPPHGKEPTGFVLADRCRLTEKGKALFG